MNGAAEEKIRHMARHDSLSGLPPLAIYQGGNEILLPGFVNGHVHVTETLIKGYIPENLGFEEGIWRWSVPLYEIQTPEEQCLGAQLAAAAMLRSGTTCFLEAGTIRFLDPVVDGLT